jgi:hypothetical protein
VFKNPRGLLIICEPDVFESLFWQLEILFFSFKASMLELLSLLMFAKNINTFMKTLILTLEHHMSVKLATFVVVFMQKKNKGSN